MGSMDDRNVFLRDVTAGEQEYARSLRGARVLYLAKVTKVEDRKLSVDGAGREHDAAPMERILVLGAYRLFSIKRRMTGLACIRQGHAQDLERVAYVEREGGRAVLQIEFRRGYEDRGGFLMTVPWETPTTSTLARSLWELWLRSGGALERRRPSLEGHLLERLAASASLDAGDAPALHVALYSRLRHYVKRAPKPRTVSALTSAAVSGILDLAMCADEDAGPASRAVSKLELFGRPEELPKLRELACGDLRYATTLSPAARGEDVAAVLDGALRRARRGLERLRVFDCSKSALSELKCPGGAWPEALLDDAPPSDAGLEALGLLLSRSAALEQLACDGQRLGPQKVTLAGLRALRDGVLGAAEGPLLQLASPLADAAGRDRKDDARRSDRCAGELDAPAPDGFVTTEAVAAFPAGDPPGAYDGDDDDGDPRPPRATSRRGRAAPLGHR
ncbi:hypothetical protein JL720_15455 [Aureococcus anophagefferens]|nr:hypothetical protein JL720_15455 [Aureococcus anophagefferens]